MASRGRKALASFVVSKRSAMETLPIFIPLGFIATVLLTLALLYRACGYNRIFVLIVAGWLVLQTALTLTGFYQVFSAKPPRFGLLVLPPVVAIILLFITRKGRAFLEVFNGKVLTLLHIVRIAVELVLFGLFIHHAVPRLMTFEGGNLDILSGLTALFVWYFGYVKQKLSRAWLLAWNIAALALLFNIVVRAVLSLPLPFQQFGFEQPNIALVYFPYSWLPTFVVPAVLLAHLINIRKLILKQS